MQKEEVRRSSRLRRSTPTVDTDVSATASSNNLTETEMSHTSNRFHCAVCSKSYSRKDSLRMHERSTHGKMKVQCTTCKKHFSSQLALDKHEVTHSDDRPHQCTVCDMTFKRVDAMKTHQLEIHQCDSESPLRCKFYWCNKEFYTKVALERHVKMHNNSSSKHWSIVRHCDDCSTTKKAPKCHQRILSETSKYLWHQCSLCLKPFKGCQALQRHKWDCSDGKQIVKIGAQCKICWKLFSSKQSLTKHEQTQHIVPTALYLKNKMPQEHGHHVLGIGGWKWVPLDPSVDLASLPTKDEQFAAYHATRRRLDATRRGLVSSSTVTSSSVHATAVASTCTAPSSSLLTSPDSAASSSPVN